MWQHEPREGQDGVDGGWWVAGDKRRAAAVIIVARRFGLDAVLGVAAKKIAGTSTRLKVKSKKK